jgi:hypothetical protein
VLVCGDNPRQGGDQLDENQGFRIQAEAARALVAWKALLADEVATKAKELARQSDSPGIVTLDHYRQAAMLAVPVLTAAIGDTGFHDGRQKAA